MAFSARTGSEWCWASAARPLRSGTAAQGDRRTDFCGQSEFRGGKARVSALFCRRPSNLEEMLSTRKGATVRGRERPRETDASVIDDDRIDFAVESKFHVHLLRRADGDREPFRTGIDVRIAGKVVMLHLHRSPSIASLNAIRFMRPFVVVTSPSRNEDVLSSWPILDAKHRLTGPNMADRKRSQQDHAPSYHPLLPRSRDFLSM